MKANEIEIEQVKIVASAVFKSIAIVSACILFGVSMQTCKVEAENIEVCNEACRQGMGYMQSVTAYECECAGNSEEKIKPWAL